MIVENPMPEFLKSEATCVSRAVYCKSCPFCRYTSTDTFLDPYNGIDPNNHAIAQYPAKAPTCTEAGWEAYEACTREGCHDSTKVELPALGHALVHHEAKASTAAEAGNIEYWYCDNCGKYFSDAAGTKEIKEADTVVAKLAPSIIAGDGATVMQGEHKALSFTSDAAFADFIRVELDGKTLDEKNYTVKDGSTIVTLNADYVVKLSAGAHTLGIVSQSGTATAKFTVSKKAAETTATTDKPANSTKSPQTGDTSNLALWIALLFVSGGADVGTTVVSRKKKYHR